MTSEERRHVSNGIWLCAIHGRLVDNDEKAFPVAKLLEWKKAAEARSALAILTLQPDYRRFGPESEPLDLDMVQRLGLPAEDTPERVVDRLCVMAREDLRKFEHALATPEFALQLTLRMVEDKVASSFTVAGIAAALGTFNELLLVAPPGTGKTTTLLQVIGSILSGQAKVAVMIPLGEWASQPKSMFESVIRRISFTGQTEGHLKLLAMSGRLVLALDGWNELDRQGRDRTRNEVRLLQREFPNLGLLISTRSQFLDVPISGPLIEVERLSEAQQLIIAAAMRGLDGERILDRAWRTPGIRNLVGIPLYLTALLARASDAALPTTREELLRSMVGQHDRKALESESFSETTMGYHTRVLEQLAMRAMHDENTTLTEVVARAVVGRLDSQLAADYQIAQGSLEPAPVLDALVNYHLLMRTATTPAAYTFQHQQFQEWYASKGVEAVMLAAMGKDVDAAWALRASFLDIRPWEESVLFACERLSRANETGASAVAGAVAAALGIDPMLAAGMIYRSSEAVWSQVREIVIAFARTWHVQGTVDRAVRFMINTGKAEFAEPVWTLISEAHDELHIQTVRASGGFRPSVLGNNSSAKLAALPQEIRESVLVELVYYGGIEGIELAAIVAAADSDGKVQAAVIEALHFRHANRQVEDLLSVASNAAIGLLADEGFAPENVGGARAEQLRAISALRIEEEQEPGRRLYLLLKEARSGADRKGDILSLVRSADLGKDTSRSGWQIQDAAMLYGRDLAQALIDRIERGLLLPQGAESLLRDSGIVLEDGPIVDLAFKPGVDRRLPRNAACLLGQKAIARLIDAQICAHKDWKQKLPVRDDLLQKECDRLKGLIALTNETAFCEALLDRAPAAEVDQICLLAELVMRHGEDGGKTSLHLEHRIHERVVSEVSRWIDVLLAAGANRNQLSALTAPIRRLAVPELSEKLLDLLSHDLHTRRTERDEFMTALVQGRPQNNSPSITSYENQYRSALSAVGGHKIVEAMKSYLKDRGYCGFGVVAANVLRDLWLRANPSPIEPHFLSWPDFSGVSIKRAEIHQKRADADPYAKAVFSVVDELLVSQSDTETISHAIQLASVAYAMPYGHDPKRIERLLGLAAPADLRLRLLTTLTIAGECLSGDLLMDAFQGFLEEAKTKQWLLDDNHGQWEQWLTLLPFCNKPLAALEALSLLPERLAQPWHLRQLLSALANAPSPQADEVLRVLAEREPRFIEEYEWLSALERRASTFSSLVLLDLICDGALVTKVPQRGGWDLSRRLATSIKAHPAIRCEVYKRYGGTLPAESRPIVENAIAEAADSEAIMLLIRVKTSLGGGMDHHIRMALERIATSHLPSSQWVGAYEVVSVPAQVLRRELFALQVAGGPEAGIAAAALDAIDRLRDENGEAEGERRHPDIESKLPYPLLPA